MAKSSTKGKKRIRFEFKAPAGSVVGLAGSFNGWDPDKKQLKDPEGTGAYSGAVMLSKGTHEYKFVVNGEWCVDPRNPNFVVTDLGTMNSIVAVE